VLLYQGWSLWTFRKRLVTPPAPPAGSEPAPTVLGPPDEINPSPST
jgi:hypothetical protein